MDNKDCLIVREIIKKGNRIDYIYELNGKWKELLKEKEPMFIEYDFNIEDVPSSILVIPFLCNILPISWVFDLQIIVNELDKQFYECIPEVKNGYINMHPMIPMLGKLEVEKIEENTYEPKTVGALFSGGVDATNTMIQHINEKPILLTLWGSDIKLNDQTGWERVKKHHIDVAKEYGLDYSFVKTNFRTMLDEQALTSYVRQKVNGEWWHDFQHGIAILGHIAPIAYLKKMKTLYIASSHTEKTRKNICCASDPTIDNYVRYGSCRVIHDGYELSRQDKVHNICEFAENNKDKNIFLRVCWKSNGGENCCECEKCYRTIIEIIAEKKDPNDFGFNFTAEKRKKMMKEMPKIEYVKYNRAYFYSDAQDTFLKNYTEEETPPDLKWFRTFKIKNKKPKYRLFYEKYREKVKKMVKKIIGKK